MLMAGLHKIGQAPPGMARFTHLEISQPAPAPRRPPMASVMTTRNFLPSILRREWNRNCRGQRWNSRTRPTPLIPRQLKISGSGRCFRNDHRLPLHQPRTSSGETLQFRCCNDCSDIHRLALLLRFSQIQLSDNC